jgi:hypothetical protein
MRIAEGGTARLKVPRMRERWRELERSEERTGWTSVRGGNLEQSPSNVRALPLLCGKLKINLSRVTLSPRNYSLDMSFAKSTNLTF